MRLASDSPIYFLFIPKISTLYCDHCANKLEESNYFFPPITSNVIK